ncbi:kinase-like domain-containing protein [Spinellus fusiger]|nr:kinase-like domain-containing protein [Spinellus fusiger]
MIPPMIITTDTISSHEMASHAAGLRGLGPRSNSSPALLTSYPQAIRSVTPLSMLHPSVDVSEKSIPTCEEKILLNMPLAALEQSITGVMQKLFPSLITVVDQFSLERISGALTNAVFFVTVNNKRYLMRIYGVGCDQLLDRESELSWLSRLSHFGIGPRLLGIFGNGRFEEFLQSTTLTRKELRCPEVSKQIAGRLCQLHSIIHIYPLPPQTKLSAWENIDKWMISINEMMPRLMANRKWSSELEAFDFDLFEQEISICRRLLNTQPSPIVFSHNDTQYGNILKLDSTNELVVIDFEYAGYNTRGYEIANHFCEWMYDYHCDTPASMKPRDFPTHEEQMVFLNAYLESNRSKTSIAHLHKEVLISVMLSHLFWGLWGLIQASQSEISFDYFLYSMQRLSAFRQELAKWTL